MKHLFTNKWVAFISLYCFGIIGLVLLHKVLSLLFTSLLWSVDLVLSSMF